MNEPFPLQPTAGEGLPVAPSLEPSLESSRVPVRFAAIDPRVVYISGVAIVLALITGFIAEFLVHLIGLVTNIAFYGRISTSFRSPAGNHLGWIVVAVPVIGGLIVGIMARYGSTAIRGHGIPEAMEQVLLNESRIPARVTLLKPLSAAIAIGTGGPFGAEGPIIATGGALGSLFGQLMKTTAMERKTLLAAGAAAGMAATFGSPVSAVLLAIELLLFEFRPRSVIPVALASATATGVRYALVGGTPIFAMPYLTRPTPEALTFYIVLGAIVGIASVYVTKAVYWIEDLFEHLPVHWMLWPAIGGVAVGVIGYFVPRTMGVGYNNIQDIVSGKLAGEVLLMLCVMKFLSWSIALGSGTSGGTLAPLFTVGGGLGAILGSLAVTFAPGLGVDVRICGLVGMAAIFAGASRALLASVVFAFETTLQPMGLLPLLGGCTTSFLISSLMMKNTIMTEKLARRGIRVPSEYAADFLDQLLVRDFCSDDPVMLNQSTSLGDVRRWIRSRAEGSGHQGYPVIDTSGHLVGVLTRRNLIDPSRSDEDLLSDLVTKPPAIVFDDSTLREAADHMVEESVGRLPIVKRSDPRRVVGIITRSDILSAHKRRLDEGRVRHAKMVRI